MFPELKVSSILIHISFHFSDGRTQYLQQVLHAIALYPFTKIDLVIDTNSEAIKNCDLEFHSDRINTVFSVHKNLQHPFNLTWQHRENMSKQFKKYDYFMYLEDDILVDSEVLERWRKDSRKLYPQGFLRGFLRTERDAAGNITSTDQQGICPWVSLKRIGGNLYYSPPNPYHGFWVYSQYQMLAFAESLAWEDGNHKEWGIRERAAAGMIWKSSNIHNVLIPIENALIPKNTMVQHLPNNYALDNQSNYGSIPVESLIDTSFKGHLRYLVNKLINLIRH